MTTDPAPYALLRHHKRGADGASAGFWTVALRRQGQAYARHFHDLVYGGPDAARQMAMAWRDALLRLVPPDTELKRSTRPRSTNTSGVPGVVPKKVRGQTVGWIAILQTPERRYSKTFSLKTHGEQAKALAIAAREDFLSRQTDRFVTLNPEASESAEQQFGDLLAQERPAISKAPELTGEEVQQRVQELNRWFDTLRPAQAHVSLNLYRNRERGHDLMTATVADGGGRMLKRGLSLAKSTYAQRLPDAWSFIEQAITQQQGPAHWQQFERRHRQAFFASQASDGFHARDYRAPADHAQRRQVPIALQPLLGDFEVPGLDDLRPATSPQGAPRPTDTPLASSNPALDAAIMAPAPRPRAPRARPQQQHRAEEQTMSRTFKAHSPLGDQLRFRSLTGREQISRLFEFRVSLLSENDSISPKTLLGQDLSVEVDLTTEKNGGGKRFLSGQVVQFAFTGRDGDYFAYEAILRPWLWLATRRSDYKIFQFKDVPTIVQEVLAPYGFTVINKLTGSYRAWDYCVQYGETDFNFISRLLEHEGAYYYFEHAQGSHKLVLGDGIGSHSPLPVGPSTHPYYPGTRAAHVHDEDFIDGWRALEDIASGHFAADDYDFKKPKALLDTKQQQPAGHPQDSREIYDWPGGYTEVGDGENYARVRIEQLKAEREVMHGAGNARNLAPGYLFNLSKYPRGDQNQQYLIEAADYRFEENVYRSDGGGGSGAAKRGGMDSPTVYRLAVEVVPAKTAYRSQRVTPKPHTTGPQTAVVVGPPGEEIYTDEYGRVKVQFHWDRYGQMNENSSCWIRVSSPWAGSNYGGIHIPRIGQEVVVDFLNGDPDYPLITGRVYNAMQMPPWDLPGNKTQSGFLTRSTKGGTPGHGLHNSPGTANAIRFEDKAGAEQLWLHAQKDQLTEVENDEDKWVGQDRRKTIDRDEFNTIHRDRTEIVDRNEKINVHGWRTEEVDLDETITIHQNRKERVDLNETISIGKNRKEDVGLNETISIGVNRSETVGNNEKVKIGVNQNLKVGSNKQETIGLTSLKNVGIAQMTNIGAAYNLNVGAVWMSNVGFMHMHNVGSSYKITVGKVYTNEVGAATHKLDSEGNQVLTAAGGAGLINMDKDGVITIKAKKIKIEADEIVDVDGKVIDLN